VSARASDAATTLAEVVDGLEGDERGYAFLGPDGERRLTFSELRDEARAAARALLAAGLSPGERVLAVLPDQHDFVRLFLGAQLAGVVPVPAYPPFMLAQLDAYLASLGRVAQAAGASALVAPPELHELLGRARPGLRLLDPAELAGDPAGPALPRVRPEDVSFLQFTSGSTAEPKGVVVTHRSLLANARTIDAHLRLDGTRDRAVSWLPLYHDMGLIGFVVVPLLDRVPAWYVPPLDFARRPQVWCETIDRVGGTIAFAPNFAYALVARRARDEELARWDLSSWRVAGCGAEPIQPAALRLFCERLAPAGFDPRALLPCYGLAEATLAVTLTPLRRGLRTARVAADGLRRDGVATAACDGEPALELASCGPVVAGHELRVAGRDSRSLPDGREGELWVRGPSVTAGYFADPERTAEGFRDGWLRTGDLGFVAGGELYVTGRRKDLIVVRGRNYHPQDLEWCAGEVRGARRGNAVAFACPGRGGEEAVALVVERRPGADPAALAEAVRERIAEQLGLRLHETVVVERETLPKTSSGKLRRAETRARYLAGLLEPAHDVVEVASP
jgi:fatty-acyl-CoA synthase